LATAKAIKSKGLGKWDKTKVGCYLLEAGRAKPFRPKKDKLKKRPEYDRDLCVKCGLCYIFCPDAAIKEVEEGYFDVDTDYCTGCGICHRECWFGAISMVEEG
jgi:pyruvate ferredoxin oxidoreductase delta subunit